MDRLVIIDFYNLLHRSYHAFPRELKNSKGVQTNAVYGFVSTLLSLLKELNPKYVVAATEKGPSFRKEQFEDYKATRTWRKDHPDEAEEMDKQVKPIMEILNAMRIPVVSVDNYEADDIIGSLSKNFSSRGIEVIVISSDMDMLQLANSFTKIYRPARPPYVKKKIFSMWDVKKNFGFGPKNIPDYKALRGDPSDNIPGVKGIGDVAAKKLVAEHGSVENIYQHIGLIGPNSLKNKLEAGKDSAFMSKDLSLIRCDVPVRVWVEGIKGKDLGSASVRRLFEKYEFKSLIDKLPRKPKEVLDRPRENDSKVGFGI